MCSWTSVSSGVEGFCLIDLMGCIHFILESSNQLRLRSMDLFGSLNSWMIRCSDAVSGVSNLAGTWMLLFQLSPADKYQGNLEEPTLSVAFMRCQLCATFKERHYQPPLPTITRCQKVDNNVCMCGFVYLLTKYLMKHWIDFNKTLKVIIGCTATTI